MFEFFAAVAAIFSAAGAVESSKAARSQRRAQQAQREQQNMRAAMERRQAIRQSRIAYAQALQNAENQGVENPGGLGSIQTQGNVNLSFINNQMDAANMAGRWLDKASKQESAARMWGSLAEMSSFAMGQFEQPDWLKSLSGGTPTRNAQIPKPRTGGLSGVKGPWGP